MTKRKKISGSGHPNAHAQEAQKRTMTKAGTRKEEKGHSERRVHQKQDKEQAHQGETIDLFVTALRKRVA